MGPKYSVGNRVRIKSHDISGAFIDYSIQSYENMTGEILGATSIVAFLSSPWQQISSGGGRITIYHYTVRINDEITLYDVTEDYLEIISQ